MSFILLFILAMAALIMIRRMEMRISELERVVRAMQTRPEAAALPVDATSEELGATRAAISQPSAEETIAAPDEEEDAPLPVATFEQAEDIAEPVEKPVEKPKRPENLESWIGARWPVWVGGLALGLGGIFMVKYSIEQGLVSPAVRLAMASLFGLFLLALGEWVRRRETPLNLPAFKNAMVPGVLTAAGIVTLFGAVYAAHEFYAYIGATTAFLLLAVISMAGVALSLLHGQALAGLGLLTAMITPALIDADPSSAWSLFSYLSIAWLATNAASRIRRWNGVPSLANFCLLCWGVVYMFSAPAGDVWPMIANQLVMALGLTFIWPAGSEMPDERDMLVAEQNGDAKVGWRIWFKRMAWGGPHRMIKLTGAFSVYAMAIAVVTLDDELVAGHIEFVNYAALVAALGFWAAWHRTNLIPAIFALFGIASAVLGIEVGFITTATSPALADQYFMPSWYASYGVEPVLILLSALFAGFGFLALLRHAARAPAYSALWSFVIWMVPLSLVTTSFFVFGNFTFDAPHGVMALVCAALFLGLAEWFWRRGDGGIWRDLHIGALVTGSYLSVVLALHALTQSVVTTILIAVVGFVYLMGVRRRPWPVLPWMMALAGVVVLARIGWQPSLVGDIALSKTPFFNQLLPGYGIPAVLTGLAAYMLKDGPDARVRNFLQALASLLALMTVAILTRHAMNGGILNSNAPTLGEQSIYTLLSVGGSAVLMTLDMKSPSPVFRWGSILIGTLSMLFALGAHLFTLNPYFSGELTGPYPVFNLLLLGYLLPALAFFGLATYARGKRPVPYIYGLSAAGAALLFAFVTLSVRRFWQGPGLADWKGFIQGELYTYSVVWLILGVMLLAAGSRFHAKSLRLASGILVLVAVLKVFLVDMSSLEGFLRALSFIGLGAVLIGIGLFYQRILLAMGKPPEEAPPSANVPASTNILSTEGEGDTPV